jgi:hypothetical protein
MAVVAGTAALTSGFNQTISSGVVTAQTIPASISLTTQYANGTAAGKVDLIHAKQYTLAGSATTIDLTSLLDLSGATVNFARIRDLVVQVVTATVDFNVTLGNAASNSWAALWGATGTHVVPAGSIFYVTDPTTVGASKGLVTSGTSKSLKLDPGANTVVVNLIIAGCSAVS